MRSLWFGIVVVVALGFAAPAQAQFRNNGIQVNVGWVGLGTWDRIIHGGRVAEQNLTVVNGAPENGWNLYDQPTFGVSGFKSIGYQLWASGEASIGVGTTVLDLNDKSTPVLTVHGGAGLRYNFLEERHRPYVAMHVHYLQFVALAAPNVIAPVAGNSFLGNTPFFIGLRPGVGYEWVFGDEQSLQVELDVAGFLVPDANRGMGGLFLPASFARLGYNIYF